jgi:hypothetical protein
MPTILRCYKRQAPEAVGMMTEHGFLPMPDGPLMIWEMPMEGALYVLGADPAGGLKDNDNCAAEVWRVGRKPGEWPVQVAEWVGHEDPITFAKTLTMLGTYYRKALLRASDGVGRGCQAALKDLPLPAAPLDPVGRLQEQERHTDGRARRRART